MLVLLLAAYGSFAPDSPALIAEKIGGAVGEPWRVTVDGDRVRIAREVTIRVGAAGVPATVTHGLTYEIVVKADRSLSRPICCAVGRILLQASVRVAQSLFDFDRSAAERAIVEPPAACDRTALAPLLVFDAEATEADGLGLHSAVVVGPAELCSAALARSVAVDVSHTGHRTAIGARGPGHDPGHVHRSG